MEEKWKGKRNDGKLRIIKKKQKMLLWKCKRNENRSHSGNKKKWGHDEFIKVKERERKETIFFYWEPVFESYLSVNEMV